MQITLTLNGVRVSEEIAPDMLLIDFVRAHGCKSVKRGCETSNCGLCTVFMDDKPVLSCSVLAARADGHKITTVPLLRLRRPAARHHELSGMEKAEGGRTVKTVNKPFRKKDAMQLVTGQPVYMDDIIPQDCLIVKLLRSPHANAIVRSINTAVAKKVPGIEAIFTWEDVPQDARRYTQAGQTYPEASPYDRLLIDRHVRFVGDVVAIVAGKDEKCVDKALKLIKVDYEVLEAVLDFHTAKEGQLGKPCPRGCRQQAQPLRPRCVRQRRY